MTVRLTTATAIAALSLTVAGCQRDSTANAPVTTVTPDGQSSAPAAAAVEERDNALVRVVHAVPAGQRVDVFADDALVFDALEYRKVTPYRELSGERHEFAVRPAGMAQAEPLAENSEGLDDGGHYTVFAVPDDEGKSAMLRIVEDDTSMPPAGKARLRVVHASGDAGDVDVFVTGKEDALVDGVNFQAVSTYDDIDPAAGTVTVRRDGGEGAMVTLRDVRFDAGRTYTMVIVGRATGSPKLEAFMIEDVASPAETAAPRR